MRLAVLFIFLSSTYFGLAQQRDTLKVMVYNLLRFPQVSPDRVDTLEKIIAYTQPDILGVCELTSLEGATSILYDALNEGEIDTYDMADYMTSPGTENELFFNTEKLGLYEQNRIETVLRDVNEYVLYYKSIDLETTGDTVFFYVYVCHLKAGTGWEEQRNIEATAIKDYMSAREQAENIILMGDFNFYGSDVEPAWNTVLNVGVPLADPLILPGDWHANSGYGWAHTQSTRTSIFDGGASGGMDDRFDFIFIGTDLNTYANDATFIDGTYKAVGQDGIHFNDALIDSPVNTSVPPDILSALYYMSDHLPVTMEIEVIKESAGIFEVSNPQFEIFFNTQEKGLWIHAIDDAVPWGEYGLQVIDLSGRVVFSSSLLGNAYFQSLDFVSKGIYFATITDRTSGRRMEMQRFVSP